MLLMRVYNTALRKLYIILFRRFFGSDTAHLSYFRQPLVCVGTIRTVWIYVGTYSLNNNIYFVNYNLSLLRFTLVYCLLEILYGYNVYRRFLEFNFLKKMCTSFNVTHKRQFKIYFRAERVQLNTNEISVFSYRL